MNQRSFKFPRIVLGYYLVCSLYFEFEKRGGGLFFLVVKSTNSGYLFYPCTCMSTRHHIGWTPREALPQKNIFMQFTHISTKKTTTENTRREQIHGFFKKKKKKNYTPITTARSIDIAIRAKNTSAMCLWKSYQGRHFNVLSGSGSVILVDENLITAKCVLTDILLC